eukprot:14121188-Heterocapsa_arctica.AAC.1
MEALVRHPAEVSPNLHTKWTRPNAGDAPNAPNAGKARPDPVPNYCWCILSMASPKAGRGRIRSDTDADVSVNNQFCYILSSNSAKMLGSHLGEGGVSSRG